MLKGHCALDGGLVRACAHVDIIHSSIGGDGALFCGAGGRVVSAEVFNDVVLDERIGGPTVNGEITIAIGAVGTTVGDWPGTQKLVNVLGFCDFGTQIFAGLNLPGTSRVPSLSTNEADVIAPCHAVFTSGYIDAGHMDSAVTPGDEAFVGTGSRTGGGYRRSVGVNRSYVSGSVRSRDGGDSSDSDRGKERAKRDHDNDWYWRRPLDQPAFIMFLPFRKTPKFTNVSF